MKALWLLALLPALAHADLYRWIDPDTGSVRFSSQAPADPRVSAEVVPYRAPAPTPAPGAAKPAAAGVPPGDTTRAGQDLLERLRQGPAAQSGTQAPAQR